MRFPFLLSFCLLLSFASQAQDITQQTISVFFPTASAELDETAQATLKSVVADIQTWGDYRLEVTAHTDSRGTNTYNQNLAQRRAQSVIQYLENQQITTDELVVQALGESQAGNDLHSEERLQHNRRVDIHLEGWQWKDLGDLQRRLRQPLRQTFTIDPTQDQLITGVEGGRFFLPANSLVNTTGETPTGSVTVELTECYALGDMLSLGLNTTSSGSILESGGMLNLTANQNGEELTLREGVSIPAAVPTPAFREDMSLFLGRGHEGNSGPQDWENTQQPISSTLPTLRLADRPYRPSRRTYMDVFLTISDEELEKILPKPKKVTYYEPRQPKEPDYDELTYEPKGLQKMFMSKAEKARRTAEVKAQAKADYEEKQVRYAERYVAWETAVTKYQQEMADYRTERRKIIDENSEMIPGTVYYATQQAKLDAHYEEQLAQYRIDSARYEQYRDYKLAKYEAAMDALGTVDQQTVNNYFFNLNRMGWANIDRFLKEQNTTPLLAQAADGQVDEEAMVFITFPERNIILRMNAKEDIGYALTQAPVGETAKLIAIKVVDRKAYLAQQEVIVTDDMILTMHYEPGRLRDIRAALEAI